MPPKNPWQYDVNQLDNKGLDVIHPIEQVEKGFYSRMEDVKSLQEGTITPRPGTAIINAIEFAQGTFTELSVATGNDSGDLLCVVVGSPADTYGTPVEFYASSGFAAKWMTLTIHSDGPIDDSTFEFEIMTGPGLTVTETGPIVLIQFTGGGIVNFEGTLLSFPVNIASGTRIGIRIKDKLFDTGKKQCFEMHIYG